MTVELILKSIQNNIQEKSQSLAKNSLLVEFNSEGKTLNVKFTRLNSIPNQQTVYESLWESIRWQLRLNSSDLKGVFNLVSVVAEFEGQQEWKTSRYININGKIKLNAKDIKFLVIFTLIAYGIFWLFSIPSKPIPSPTSDEPSTQKASSECVTIPLSSVPSGTSPEAFKNELKKQTGAKCILYDLKR